MENSAPVLIIDALNLFTRHFVANPAMSSTGSRAGQPAGGIVGFLNNVRWLVERLRPGRIVVVWESGGSQRKRKLFSEYKAHRRPQKLNRYYDDDLPDSMENRNWQIAFLVSILRQLGVCQVYVKDCEADDVIGYICRYKFADNIKIIVSSDKDFYQLITDKVRVYSPTWKKFVQKDEVIDKFGISPTNFCTAKALCGDPSDNIPGVKGVGFKTLAKRFPKLASDDDVSVTDIIEEAKNSATSKGPKVYKALSEAESLAKRNWTLMYLDMANLSGAQVKQINNAIDTFTPHRDKMGIMRSLVKAGLSTVDVDRLFLACQAHLKN